MSGRIVSINLSEKKGVKKRSVDEANIRENYGIEGDAHASDKWHRQLSMLAIESINKMQKLGLNVGPGDFAENITTEGVDLLSLPVGTRLMLGKEVEVEVSQIGKECHTRCAIYRQAGDCVMPKEGIFVRVIRGGKIRTGDEVRIQGKGPVMIKVAILTLSDKASQGLRKDESGEIIKEMIKDLNAELIEYEVLPDERDLIKERLIALSKEADLILTTGGTGVSPRDVTPDATRDVIDYEIPGIAEAMRQEGMRHTPFAMISRAIAGVRGRTLIVNLPGSPGGVRDCLSVIRDVIPHAIEKIKGSKEECT